MIKKDDESVDEKYHTKSGYWERSYQLNVKTLFIRLQTMKGRN